MVMMRALLCTAFLGVEYDWASGRTCAGSLCIVVLLYLGIEAGILSHVSTE
jgi:hypothetical protein